MPGKKNDVMSRIRLKRSDSGVKLLGKNYCWWVKKSWSAGSTADSICQTGTDSFSSGFFFRQSNGVLRESLILVSGGFMLPRFFVQKYDSVSATQQTNRQANSENENRLLEINLSQIVGWAAALEY